MTEREKRAAEIAIIIVLAIFLHPATELHAGTVPVQLIHGPMLALIGIVTFLLFTRMVVASAAYAHMLFDVRPLLDSGKVLALTCSRLC